MAKPTRAGLREEWIASSLPLLAMTRECSGRHRERARSDPGYRTTVMARLSRPSMSLSCGGLPTYPPSGGFA